MSDWAGIKKAINSNIDVPLDKKLDNVLNSKCSWIYQTGTLSSGAHDILLVNGSGYLHELVYTPSTKDSYFYVYIDGELLLAERNIGNYTNAVKSTVLFNERTSTYVYQTLSGGTQLSILLPKSQNTFGVRNFTVTTSGTFVRAGVSGYITVDSSTSRNTTDTHTFVVLPFPLRFKKSLRILYTGNGNTSPEIIANYSVD